MSSARRTLQVIARRAMTERGLEPSFPPEVLTETKKLTAAPCNGPSIKDLRGLVWCSIDNDDSRDLDQLSVAEARPNGDVRVLIAIADVDAAVERASAVDLRTHARLAIASVVFDRQRRLARSRSAVGGGNARERRCQSARRHRRRRCDRGAAVGS